MGKMCEGTSNWRSLNVIQLEKVLEWRITIRDMTIDAVEEDSVGSLVGAGDRNGAGDKTPALILRLPGRLDEVRTSIFLPQVLHIFCSVYLQQNLNKFLMNEIAFFPCYTRSITKQTVLQK